MGAARLYTPSGDPNRCRLSTGFGYHRGLLRARPLLDVDLEAEILDVCVASCEGDGIANARIEIRNLGGDVPPDPIPVSLWGIELSGTKVLIHQAEVAPVAPGETWGTDVPFPPFAFIDLELVVDEDNRFAECEEKTTA